jgi:hypothetical protein
MKRKKAPKKPTALSSVAEPAPSTEIVVAPSSPPEPKVRRPLNGKLFKPGHDPRRGRGCAKGAPNAGRPPNRVRVTFREILREEGAEAAREILKGEPDKQGRVPDHAERRNWLRELAEIGFNERLRIAKLRAEAAAEAGSKAQAGVQLILQGGPAGNLQPT